MVKVTREEHLAALALRIVEYLKLIDATSEFGTITFKIRHNRVIQTDLGITDTRPLVLGDEEVETGA